MSHVAEQTKLNKLSVHKQLLTQVDCQARIETQPLLEQMLVTSQLQAYLTEPVHRKPTAEQK